MIVCRSSREPARHQLDVLRGEVEKGVDPRGLALWLSRVAIIEPLTVDTIAAAAEDLRDGRGQQWYAAAEEAAK